MSFSAERLLRSRAASLAPTPTRGIAMMSLARNRSAIWHRQSFSSHMKLQPNAGDWATIAFFALAVMLGVYEKSRHDSMLPGHSSEAPGSRSGSVRAAATVIGLE